LIVLQLKSAQEHAALDNISRIIKEVRKDHDYRIRGHEIHQVAGVMRRTPLAERAKMVSSFCAANELEYISYHAPILYPGDNIWDEKRRGKVIESIKVTVEEAEAVCKEAGLHKPVIVFHLTSYVPMDELPPTWEAKLALLEKAEHEFIALYRELAGSCTLAVENTYPRYKPDGSANIGPFHPAELVRLARYGFATTLDLAHYQLYSNYLKYGRHDNAVGDLDRRHYGLAPGWGECAKILGGSLVQLHISDARGADIKGEALPLGKGEIPVAAALKAINDTNNSPAGGRTMWGTLELGGGHLDGARLQLQGAKWLLKNVPEVFRKEGRDPKR
jgi:sugar phosphate isomerase/epimerase